MTKAEAIAMLKRIQEPEAWEPQINQAAFEALDMAIESLSQESSEDTISRQAAIALAKDIIVPIKDGTVYKYRCIDPDSIKELPSECNVIYCRDCRFYIGY